MSKINSSAKREKEEDAETRDMFMMFLRDMAVGAVKKGKKSDAEALKYALESAPFLDKKPIFRAFYPAFVCVARADAMMEEVKKEPEKES
jgi:hypothetical protein